MNVAKIIIATPENSNKLTGFDLKK